MNAIRIVLASALSVGALACSRSTSGPNVDAVNEAGFPLEIEGAGGHVTVILRSPTRVIPANSSAVDFTCALLGPERLAALPQVTFDYALIANLPGPWENVPTFEGFDAETLLDHEPDLIIAHAWQSMNAVRIVGKTGAPTLLLPVVTSWADVEHSLRLVARAVGREERAEQVLSELATRRQALADGAKGVSPLRILTYSNFGTGGYTAGSNTTLDELVRMAGHLNAALELGLEGNAKIDFDGLLALDPDVLLIGGPATATEGRGTEAVLRGAQSLQGLRALRDGQLVILPAPLFSSGSQGLVDGAEFVAQACERFLVPTETEH